MYIILQPLCILQKDYVKDAINGKIRQIHLTNGYLQEKENTNQSIRRLKQTNVQATKT